MFLELTLSDDIPLVIAVAHIIAVCIDPADDTTAIYTPFSNVPFKVSQSMEHVKLMLKAARNSVDTII